MCRGNYRKPIDDKQTDMKILQKTSGQKIDRQINRQIDRQVDKSIGRQIDRGNYRKPIDNILTSCKHDL